MLIFINVSYENLYVWHPKIKTIYYVWLNNRINFRKQSKNRYKSNDQACKI